MTTSYYRQDDDWYTGEWADYEDDGYYAPAPRPIPFDIVILAAVALIVIGLVAVLSQVNLSGSVAPATVPRSQPMPRQESGPEAVASPAAPSAPLPGSDAFIMPYSDYILTQGPHGISYGHYAIDLYAGKGEPVLSPINGRVSALYIDDIGNPTLVIENERFEVTMMHGNYTVQIGQEIVLGEQVGTESNKGNTRDMTGNSCRNRDCGYHTHLNVYDKQAGQNVNPLDLLNR